MAKVCEKKIVNSLGEEVCIGESTSAQVDIVPG